MPLFHLQHKVHQSYSSPRYDKGGQRRQEIPEAGKIADCINATPRFPRICQWIPQVYPRINKEGSTLYDFLKGSPGSRLLYFNYEQLGALNALIKVVLKPEILAISKTRLRHLLDTDASNYQVGCALFRAHPDKKLTYLLWSRTLNSADRNYSATEKECLSLVYGMMICHPHLFGGKYISTPTTSVLGGHYR